MSPAAEESVQCLKVALILALFPTFAWPKVERGIRVTCFHGTDWGHRDGDIGGTWTSHPALLWA